MRRAVLSCCLPKSPLCRLCTYRNGFPTRRHWYLKLRKWFSSLFGTDYLLWGINWLTVSRSDDFSGLSRLSGIFDISPISVKAVKEQDAHMRILASVQKSVRMSLLRLLHTNSPNFKLFNTFSGTRVCDFSTKILTIEVQITRFHLLPQIQASGVCCRSTQNRRFFAMTYKGQDSIPRIHAGIVLMSKTRTVLI